VHNRRSGDTEAIRCEASDVPSHADSRCRRHTGTIDPW
jgi:hypothetical protein